MGRKRTRPIKPPAFDFKVGEYVIYFGAIYKEYANQKGEVIERSKKSNKQYYTIKFLDGHTKIVARCVLKGEEV